MHDEELSSDNAAQGSSVSPESTYSTQGKMLKALGREKEAGLCGPLANLYARNQITGTNETDVLSKKNTEVYAAAVAEEHLQHALRQQGQDGKHSAFVVTKTPHEVQTFAAEAVKDLNVDSVLPTPGHTIITFPVEDPWEKSDTYHQVYLGKLNDKECLIFDAEREGGSKKDNCQALFSEIVNAMSTRPDSSRPRKVATIATTSFFAPKSADEHAPSHSPGNTYS
ncbi:hypothetical protein TUM19329_14750 [Legionella antarctica]|uniref:Uncharacterized protein n=1 Tax=Legionella antarctica TaxID=2708020 RepID=A0A6F8T351_9GAMM|nr:hypothetical protein TUM19329_14750 [Legionella antarctica]